MENQENTNNPLVIISKIISGLINPFIIPFVSFYIFFLYSDLQIMPRRYKMIVLVIIFCFTILMPVFTIHLFRKITHLTPVQLGERRQRYFPYLLTITSYIFCLFMTYKLSIPWYMVGIILSALIIQIIFFIANVKWRLSGHMGGIGAVIGGIVSFSVVFGFNPVWCLCLLIIMAGFLGSARIISGNHTFGEVFFGFSIGFLCAFLILNPFTNYIFRFLLIQ